MKTFNQLLKEIGYNDSPLRREVINAFKKFLQQNPPHILETTQEFYERLFVELEQK